MLLLVAAYGPAIADETDAKPLYNRAATAYALGRYSEAAKLFERVFELKQDPAVLYDAAQAHRLAGEKLKALVLY
ncbi:MAG: tetratricopeptide repeat protein, partial [Steroidobacteraceae bacterium]